MNTRFALLTVVIFWSVVLFAQEDSTCVISIDGEPECPDTTVVCIAADSLFDNQFSEPEFIVNKTVTESIFEKRFVQSTFIGVPLVLAGLIEMEENSHFRSLRNDFLPKFKHEFENYVQYSPAVALLSMKALGVQGQSSWGKMLTADMLSSLMMAGVTRGIKRIAREERPDGTAQNSFPSGHTATAFMTATMLAKEYGYISPWIPVAGYTAATATGVMRMVNNRHWMSDVLSGAGIGIICTEFGYWLADALFPKTKKSYDPKTMALSESDGNPSFFELYAGFYTPIKTQRLTDKIRSSSGGTAGFEGAWFWNRHWGIGGQLGVSDMDYIMKNDDDVVGSVHFCTTQAGCFYSLPLYERLFVRAKAMTGCVFFPRQNEAYVTSHRRVGYCYTSGITFGLRTHQHFDFNVSCDYCAFQSNDRGKTSHYHTLILTGGATIRF